jgi:hypothetical protein
MKNSNEAVSKRLSCGMVSLKMFKINHSKALIIAYLNLRGGLKKYTFNVSDISKQTDIGKTVVRQYLKELVAEGVLNRKGMSFYKLNRQKMEELYYLDVSESDLEVSETDNDLSETDTKVSESDTDVSESDSIHSSNLHSRILNSKKLDSSKLNTSQNLTLTTSGQTCSFSLRAQLPDKTLTVSGTGLEPLIKPGLSISGQTTRATTPATDTNRRPIDSELPGGVEHQQPSPTVPDELAKRLNRAEACRQIRKLNGRNPELFEKYFDEIFAR